LNLIEKKDDFRLANRNKSAYNAHRYHSKSKEFLIMSQHQSLKVDSVGSKHRNVLSRIERIKKMTEQKRWKTDSSAFNLPKMKSIKVKAKKSAAGPKEAVDAAKAGAAAPAAGKKAAAPAGKK
jgi:small basic protein (TIGR04137 family)